MTTTFNFDNSQRLIVSTNEDVVDHADIDLTLENYDTNHKGEEVMTYAHFFLKEHEAVYLANAILRFVETTRKENERWHADQEQEKD